MYSSLVSLVLRDHSWNYITRNSVIRLCFKEIFKPRANSYAQMAGQINNDEEKNAGIIIIGDEILKGHTQDSNASFLLSNLWSNGVTVRKVSFIPDNVDKIAKEISSFSSKYSLVITCGGIGPTHDDMTFEGAAKAFNEPLIENSEMKKKILNYADSEVSPAWLKMAMLPKSTKLITGIDPLTNQPMRFPLFCIENVFIFPGVPEFLKKGFNANIDLFIGNSKFHTIKVYLSASEGLIAKPLEKINEEYPNVQIGSYPMINDFYKVKVTLESQDTDDLTLAYNSLIANLSNDMIVSVKKCLPNSRTVHHQLLTPRTHGATEQKSNSSEMKSLSIGKLDDVLSAGNTTSLSSAVKCAWSVFSQTLHMYSPDEICLCFNGGKDCTVILHLYVAFMQKMYPNHTSKLNGLYIKHENCFEEADDFIEACRVNYNLDLITIGGSIHDGLEKLSVLKPNIKAAIMGTRRDDPYSLKLRSFSFTDPGWPEYMRVLPILDWSYAEVWSFLRSFDLPYCSLYDQGYTSLGSPLNTYKNPSLMNADGTYSPAYTLTEGSAERSGRESN